TAWTTTTTTAPNMFVGSNGTLARSTSARRYKVAIDTVEEEKALRLLDIDPRSWFDRGDAERYATYLERCAAYGPTPNPEVLTTIAPIKRVMGLVAEEVEDAGLSEYVVYDEEGQVQGLSYERLWTLLIPLVRDQRGRIEILEQDLAALRGEM